MSRGLPKKIWGVEITYLLLALLVVFHVINNLYILKMDNTPFLWDGGDYFYRSLRYYDIFASFDSDFISKFNEVSPYRPPLFLLTSLPFYFIFGKAPDIAVMTNVVYLIILVLSVYGIGRKIHSERAGLLASFIVSTFPILFGLSRSYWLDYPLTAMVALSVYLLLRTEHFTNRKYSLLFGVSVGLGMLTKWTHFVFLAGPFLYLLLISFRVNPRKREGSTGFVSNVAISIIVGIIVAAFWYVPNGLNVATKLFGLAVGVTGEATTRFQQLGETFGPPGVFNINSISFYAGQLVNHQATFFHAILLTLLALYLLKRREDKETVWMLLLWIVVPIVAFTLIKNKTARNTVPILPAIGLLIAFGTMKVRKIWVRRGLVAAVVAFGFVQYAASSYGTSYLPKKVSKRIPLGDVVLFQQHDNASYALYQAKTGDWQADEILRVIDSSKGEKKSVDIVLIPRDAFTWMAMEYSSYLKGMPFTFIGAVDFPEAVLSADFVLIKKGGFVAPWFLMENIHRSLELMQEERENFTLLKSVALPEDRLFLPIYDIKAKNPIRKSGVVFSGRLQVLEYSVAETRQKHTTEFTVESTLKSISKMDDELMVVFNVLNKRMGVVMRKAVRPLTPLSDWKPNEVKKLRASLVVPEKQAKELFSLEMGYYDRSVGEILTYQPEYLIYKRKKFLE